MTLSLA